jgi:hypothetical protein
MAGFVIPVLLCMEVQIEGLWFKLPGHEVNPVSKINNTKRAGGLTQMVVLLYIPKKLRVA